MHSELAECRELESLLSSLAVDHGDRSARDRMNALLCRSEAARQLYVQHCQVQAMLHSSSGLLRATAGGDRDDADPAAASGDRFDRATGRPITQKGSDRS